MRICNNSTLPFTVILKTADAECVRATLDPGHKTTSEALLKSADKPNQRFYGVEVLHDTQSIFSRTIVESYGAYLGLINTREGKPKAKISFDHNPSLIHINRTRGKPYPPLTLAVQAALERARIDDHKVDSLCWIEARVKPILSEDVAVRNRTLLRAFKTARGLPQKTQLK